METGGGWGMTRAQADHLKDLEAEREVLGVVLLRPEALPDALAEVDAADFADHRHGLIFGAMRALAREDRPADLFQVVDALRRSGELDRVGGEPYLSGLTEIIGTVSRVGGLARIVADRARARRTFVVLQQQAARLRGGAGFDDVAADLTRAIVGQARADTMRTVGEVADATLAKLRDRIERGGVLPGLETGIPDLDRIVGGLGPGHLVILAARPSMGKTTLALNIALHVAGQGRQVVFVSLEMKDEPLVERAASDMANVPLAAIRHGRLHHEDQRQVEKVLTAILPGMPLLIDSPSGTTIDRLVARAKMAHLRRRVDLVVVDYLQLVRCPGASIREREVAEVSSALKALAMSLGAPVLALSQLSRQAEDRRPRLADLRESGAIEQDADVVLLLHRDRLAAEGSPTHGVVLLDVAKNRHGPTGDVRLRFEGAYSRFLPESV